MKTTAKAYQSHEFLIDRLAIELRLSARCAMTMVAVAPHLSVVIIDAPKLGVVE
jgi:hypothetical protein